MNDLNMSLTNPGVAVTKAYVDTGDNALSLRVAELEKSNPRAYGVEFTKGQLDPIRHDGLEIPNIKPITIYGIN